MTRTAVGTAVGPRAHVRHILSVETARQTATKRVADDVVVLASLVLEWQDSTNGLFVTDGQLKLTAAELGKARKGRAGFQLRGGGVIEPPG